MNKMFKKIISLFKREKKVQVEQIKMLNCSCGQKIYETSPHKRVNGRLIHRIGAVNYRGALMEIFCNGKESRP